MIDKEDQAQQPVPPTKNNTLAIVSMVLGVVSLTGPGLLLGIPAIITAIIALKKKQGDRGLSITGLVTGIISTVISLLFIALMVFLIIWGINHPEDHQRPYNRHTEQNEHLFRSSET